MKLVVKNIFDAAGRRKLDAVLQAYGLADYCIETGGEVSFPRELLLPDLKELEQQLRERGLGILYERKEVIAEKVKHLVEQLVNVEEPLQETYSAYLSNGLNLNYSYLANAFSSAEGITIEHYIIQQKIARAIMLLAGNFNVTEVAEKLHYSNIAHFSSQFKKITGSTPSAYKRSFSQSSEETAG